MKCARLWQSHNRENLLDRGHITEGPLHWVLGGGAVPELCFTHASIAEEVYRYLIH